MLHQDIGSTQAMARGMAICRWVWNTVHIIYSNSMEN